MTHDSFILVTGSSVYDITVACGWHDSCMCVTWLMRICDMTHAYMQRDSGEVGWRREEVREGMTWLIHMCDTTHAYMWRDSGEVGWRCEEVGECWKLIFGKFLFEHRPCVLHMSHDSFICVTWLIHTCDMTHLYVWHDSFIRVTWLIHMCDMTHSYVWHDSFICVTRISLWALAMCPAHVTWLIYMCDTTHSYVRQTH